MQDVIAVGIVVVTSWWLFRHFARVAKSGKCGGCDHAQDAPGAARPDRGLKRTPLVPPEQIGMPTAERARGDKA